MNKILSPAFYRELKSLISLAIPLMIAQVFQSLVNFADVVMAGNVSSLDLAGVAVGGSIFGVWVIFICGTLMAVSPSVAQLRGSGKVEEVGSFIHQSLWLSVFLGICSFFLLRNCEIVLYWMEVDSKIIPLAMGYIMEIFQRNI